MAQAMTAEVAGETAEAIAQRIQFAHQGASLKQAIAHPGDNLIQIETEGTPSLFKQNMEEIEKLGFKLSGMTTESTFDGDELERTGVNLWFRPKDN